MLYLDSRYFADEDGFGKGDNEEENFYCFLEDVPILTHPQGTKKIISRFYFNVWGLVHVTLYGKV